MFVFLVLSFRKISSRVLWWILWKILRIIQRWKNNPHRKLIGIFDQPVCLCVPPSSSSSPSLILSDPTLYGRTKKTVFRRIRPTGSLCCRPFLRAGQIGIFSHIFSGIFTTVATSSSVVRDLITRRPTLIHHQSNRKLPRTGIPSVTRTNGSYPQEARDRRRRCLR